MGIKRTALDCLVSLMKTAIRVSTGKHATQIHAHLAEQFSPVITQDAGAAGTLRFYCPGVLPEYRARTLLTKEPETIEWLNSMGKGEVLWDIGANVGIYSLYAAQRGVAVQAFEPAPGNYYLLHRNIELNHLDHLIDSYCLAFNDESRLDAFHMSTTDLGGSTSSFGEPTDWKGETYVAKFKQSMIGFTVDGFIAQFAPPRPHHIKIDVDGIEHVDYVWKGEPIAEVVGGASKYEWMIASHVLEHIPDPIRFLQGVAEILTPTGRFSMALPDKRYCFDHFQPLSNTGALLDAFTEERVKPTAGQVFQYFAHCAQLDGNIAWASGLGGEVEFRHDLTMGTNGWRGALDDADFGGEVHCWRFTPESFRLLIAELGTMGLIDLKIVDSRPTNGSEFFVTLGHGRTIVTEEERIALVRAAISSDHER